MNIDKALDNLSRDPSASFDVAELALELARDEYPELDVEAYLSELAGMAREARTFLRGNLDKQVVGLCRFLFHEMGFRGNVQHYYDPRNSYLNQVLDRRTGIPITLSVVAITIGQRAGVQVAGVGLPGHFVAKAVDGSREIFFDPFHGGRVLTVENCEQLVEQVTGTPFRATPSQLEAITLGAMVQRMLSNLKSIYLREGEFLRVVRVIQRLRRLNPRDPLLLRDLGVSLLNAGQPGKAIDSLQAYLATAPPVADATAVHGFLDKAMGDVAKWN
jgi:regulator of sirC expression with transglutaminase-like and TPR domain